MDEFFRRIYYLLNRRRLQRELEQDMAVHREMLGVEHRTAFGNPAALREQANAAWGWSWLERLCQDLAFGARMLRRSPGLTLTAVIVLALGIGVNVTAFNFVDLLFFRPLPVRDPYLAPIGSVLVYGSRRAAGHIEFRTRDGFVSDFKSKTPSRRPLLGVYAKI